MVISCRQARVSQPFVVIVLLLSVELIERAVTLPFTKALQLILEGNPDAFKDVLNPSTKYRKFSPAHPMKYSLLLFFVAVSNGVAIANAAVQLASPFGQHMVLQQGRSVPVWGNAAAGETITVEFAGQKKTGKANPEGKWRIDLDALTASAESRVLTVRGNASLSPIEIGHVLVGEVWICSGQSNMERQLGPRPPQQPLVNWQQEVAEASHPLIRQFHVMQKNAAAPQTNLSGTWTVCSPATAADFTAVGYFFARDLQEARKVPVGIIHSSWGGTPAEAWTSRTGLAAIPEFNESLTQLDRVTADPEGARHDYLAKLIRWYRDNEAGLPASPFRTNVSP